MPNSNTAASIMEFTVSYKCLKESSSFKDDVTCCPNSFTTCKFAKRFFRFMISVLSSVSSFCDVLFSFLFATRFSILFPIAIKSLKIPVESEFVMTGPGETDDFTLLTF